MSGTAPTEVIIQGEAREQAIPVAFMLAGTALEATASELTHWTDDGRADPVAYAKGRATQLLSGAIDDFEGDEHAPVHPVVVRLAEALVSAETAALAVWHPQEVASVLTLTAEEFLRIAEVNE